MLGSVLRHVLVGGLGLSLLAGAAWGQAKPADDFLEMYLDALQYDPVYQRARLERDISVAGLDETYAGVKPSLSADIDTSKVYQDIRQSDNPLFQIGKTDFFDARLRLSLNQPIYRAEVLRRIPQGKAQIRKAEAKLAAAEQDLMVRLSEAVFNAMAARDVLDFSTAERTAIERQLEESQERLGSGLSTITDVHEARAKYEDAQAREIEAQDSLTEAMLAIAEITGKVPTTIGHLSASFPLVAPDPGEPDAWVRTALFQNLELDSVKEDVEIAELEIRAQKAARMPTLSFVASFNGSDSGGSVFLGGGGSNIFTTDVGLQLGIPIYDGGTWSARARAATLQHQATLQDLELAKTKVERDARVSFQGVVSGITRVEAYERAVFAQERALESSEEGFRSGLTTGRAVLDTRSDLFSAQRDYSRSRYLYVLSTLRLKRTTGSLGLDDMRHINANIE